MLFKQHILDAIAAGKVTLAFRRWRRPTVKPGGTLRTSVGVLAIKLVQICKLDGITARDARQAGFDSLEALLRDIERQREGDLYRIQFSRAGADPRIALRKRAALPAREREELQRRLARLDKASRTGPWTLATLRIISDKPATRAGELADALGMEKLAFKRNVRKLKELGLTESLGTGYRLSPRGKGHLRSI